MERKRQMLVGVKGEKVGETAEQAERKEGASEFRAGGQDVWGVSVSQAA